MLGITARMPKRFESTTRGQNTLESDGTMCDTGKTRETTQEGQ